MVGWWAPFGQRTGQRNGGGAGPAEPEPQKTTAGQAGLYPPHLAGKVGAGSTHCEDTTQHDQGCDLRMRTRGPAGCTSVPLCLLFLFRILF